MWIVYKYIIPPWYFHWTLVWKQNACVGRHRIFWTRDCFFLLRYKGEIPTNHDVDETHKYPSLTTEVRGYAQKWLGQMPLFCIYFPSSWPIKGRFSSYEQTWLCSFFFFKNRKTGFAPFEGWMFRHPKFFFGLLEMIGAVHISTDLAETLTSINLKIFTSL